MQRGAVSVAFVSIEKNHIGLAIRALARLSLMFYRTGISHYELKRYIVRDAVRNYRIQPAYRLDGIAKVLQWISQEWRNAFDWLVIT